MSGTPGSSGTPGAQSRRRTAQYENLVGRTLRDGEYVIEAVLGQGGMGRVFLASHTTLFVPVAIKLATLYWGQQPVMEGTCISHSWSQRSQPPNIRFLGINHIVGTSFSASHRWSGLGVTLPNLPAVGRAKAGPYDLLAALVTPLYGYNVS